MKRLVIGLMAASCFGCAGAAALLMPVPWLLPGVLLNGSLPGPPGEPKRLTMEQVCDPARDKKDDIPAFVALCPTAAAPAPTP